MLAGALFFHDRKQDDETQNKGNRKGTAEAVPFSLVPNALPYCIRRLGSGRSYSRIALTGVLGAATCCSARGASVI